MTAPSLWDRFEQQFEEVEQLSGWDVTPLTMRIGPSKRGRGPGLSAFVMTASGLQFEEVIQPGDDVPAFFGKTTH